jgi:hypothetical protein
MTKRKMVDVNIALESFYNVLDQMTPGEVIERMKELQAGYPGRYVYFNVSSYGHSDGKELELWERREETDKEFNKRIAEESKIKVKQKETNALKEAKELAEYQRLKKKFGDISYFDK